VVGGSGGTPGAAVLAGTAALRAGAGLATLATADDALRRALIELRPELMLSRPDDRFIAAADTLVVGPGLTAGRAGLVELDETDPRAMVWDASALDEFGGRRSAGPRILTPHPGEAARLLARLDEDEGADAWTNARVVADRRGAAERLVRLTQATVVLKGAGTLVAARSRADTLDDIRVRVSTTGGPSLASAGSGDVLAGAIAGLMARGLDPWTAACLGVHAHGLAGDACPADGTLAMDVADRLPAALADLAAGQQPARWPRLRRG
jgi:NAD(P)H-hydrate epimerase